MANFNERRTDSHVQMLVEVGVRLCRSRGHEYARGFLKNVHVPECIIERVLETEPAASSVRRIRHVTYDAKSDVDPEISADH